MVTDEQRTTLARCYVAIAEVDYDLTQWEWALWASDLSTRHFATVAE